MRKDFYILLVLLFAVSEVSAQSDYHDQLANDPTSAAAGAYQAKRSLWSLGSNDMSSWTVPARTQSGAWTQQRVHSNRNITIRPPQRRVSRTTQQKAAKKAQRDAEHSEWLEKRNAQIEAAKEAQRDRDRIRRQREAAEDAADRQAGYARHMSQTAGYYRSQQARDQAMAIEAMRLNEQYTARRMATPPPTNTAKVETMANEELAALLEPQPEAIGSLVYEAPQTHIEGSFSDAQQGHLAVTNNLYYDQESWQKWQWAAEESNVLNFTHTRTQPITQEPILLLSHEEYSVDSVTLFVLPSYGLVMPVGDSLLLLKDRSLSAVAWQDGRRYTSAFVCGDKLIGRQGKAIYTIEDQPTPPLLQFDTEEYSLFTGDNRSLYALFWYENLSSIFQIDLSTKNFHEIVRVPLPIWKVVANEHRRFILIEDDIYLLTEEGEPHLFYRSKERINDLDFSPWGLLLTTDKEVIRISSATKTETFYPYGAHQVWLDGNEVYLLDQNCDLLLIPNGADYIHQQEFGN